MSSSHSQPPTSEDPRPRTDRPRRATTRKALVWLLLAAGAAFPFPWWW